MISPVIGFWTVPVRAFGRLNRPEQSTNSGCDEVFATHSRSVDDCLRPAVGNSALRAK